MLEPAGAAPLCVTFRVSLAEYLGAVRGLAARQRWVQVFAVIIVGAVALGFAWAWVGSLLLASLFFVGGIVYAFLLLWTIVIRPRRQYRRISDLSGDQTYCFSDDEVSWTFATGASHVKWAYFSGLVETKEMFLLRHPMRSLFSFVPKRAFKTREDETRFRQLVRQIRKSSGLRATPKA